MVGVRQKTKRGRAGWVGGHVPREFIYSAWEGAVESSQGSERSVEWTFPFVLCILSVCGQQCLYTHSQKQGEKRREWRRWGCPSSKAFVCFVGVARERKQVIKMLPLSLARSWYVFAEIKLCSCCVGSSLPIQGVCCMLWNGFCCLFDAGVKEHWSCIWRRECWVDGLGFASCSWWWSACHWVTHTEYEITLCLCCCSSRLILFFCHVIVFLFPFPSQSYSQDAHASRGMSLVRSKVIRLFSFNCMLCYYPFRESKWVFFVFSASFPLSVNKFHESQSWMRFVWAKTDS